MNRQGYHNFEYILQEFRRYDRLHSQMQQKIENDVYNVIANYAGEVREVGDINAEVKSIALNIINCSYSVIDKDLNYPAYRLESELKNVSAAIERFESYVVKSSFTSEFGKAIVNKCLEYFPAILDLSANGLRLFDKNIKYYSYLFGSLLVVEQ